MGALRGQTTATSTRPGPAEFFRALSGGWQARRDAVEVLAGTEAAGGVGAARGQCESFRVLMCACTVWTFCPRFLFSELFCPSPVLF